MNIAVFSTKPYDREFLNHANQAHEHHHKFRYLEPRLTEETVKLADGYPAICVFVNDIVSEPVLKHLSEHGTKLIALRCAGFNNVDLNAARDLGIRVVRVPAYSPYAVAEHAVAMIMALNRRVYRAYNRVREGNFSLDGLAGFDVHGRTVGVIGTGIIGSVFASIIRGFGVRLLAHDPYPSDKVTAIGGEYVPLDTLIRESDIISLHCPLNRETYHLIDEAAFEKMKPGAMLINTSRGGLVDAHAAIEALKSGRLGYLGMDVYEEEEDLFFEDMSGQVIRDDLFARLLVFPNVLITGHQAFFTNNALEQIAATTLENISAFERGGDLPNEVVPKK